MNAPWFGRAARTLAAAAGVALLAACGSGSVVSDLTPKRFITVGDGFMDVGQAGYRYTVNDGSNIWVQDLASHYNQTVTAASAGGWGYAQGNARVAAADTSPVAAPSITAQIDAERLTFPASLPAACARFCIGRASLAALTAERLSSSAAEAARMQRPDGKMLCPG